MVSFLTFIVLLVVGIIFGRANEANHIKRLKADEEAFSHIKVFNLRTMPQNLSQGGALVMGNVVIAVDYFKVFMSSIRMFFGGRLNSYETLIDSARREAIVRMQKDAENLGADAIYNARFEFSKVGQQPQGGGVELLAYGTAVKFEDADESRVWGES